MTNPIADISDPATLRALVQDGVKCEACDGRQWPQIGPDACPVCCGPGQISGKVPLPNPDLDALAACWCEGEWVQKASNVWQLCRLNLNGSAYWGHLLSYTTSPDAAMRLMVKYKLQPKIIELQGKEYWYVLCGAGSEDCSVVEGATVEALCQALTEAALIAALTEAIKGQAKEETNGQE